MMWRILDLGWISVFTHIYLGVPWKVGFHSSFRSLGCCSILKPQAFFGWRVPWFHDSYNIFLIRILLDGWHWQDSTVGMWKDTSEPRTVNSWRAPNPLAKAAGKFLRAVASRLKEFERRAESFKVPAYSCLEFYPLFSLTFQSSC